MHSAEVHRFYWQQRLVQPNARDRSWPDWVDVNRQQPELLLNNRYVLHKSFLRGKGKVWVAFDIKLEKLVVVKKMPKERFLTGRTHQNEAAFPDLINTTNADNSDKFSYSPSSHCIQVYDYFVNEDGEEYFVTQYLKPEEYESLNSFTFTFDFIHPQFALNIILAVLRVLIEWYQHGIYHRDVHPSNIYVRVMDEDDYSDCYVVFGDFTLSLSHDEYLENTQELKSKAEAALAGAPAYLPPEVYEDYGLNLLMPETGLVWIVGTMLAEMLGRPRPSTQEVGGLAFTNSNQPGLNAYFNRLIKAGFDANDLDEVISLCVENNPNNRIQKLGELLTRLTSLTRLQSPTYSLSMFSTTPPHDNHAPKTDEDTTTTTSIKSSVMVDTTVQEARK